jgi:NAD(P)-dependent dehydrogenase (short-subunit alcohol dehydrogenase family)
MRTFKQMMDLSGRVALVTGGAGHLGGAICDTLAELGAGVAIVDMEAQACSRAAVRLNNEYGVEALALAADLQNQDDLTALPQKVGDKFGRIDILVNCAALVGTSSLKGWGVPFSQQSPDTWRMALEVNLTAPFILSQLFEEGLSQSGHGTIINISSIYGVVGPNMSLYKNTNMGNPAAYGSSKAGLLQLTRYLATALAPKIRVNAITPGGIFRSQAESFLNAYTQLTPMSRMATEEDFKGAVGYLASDLSEYMTGQNLIIDGGWTVW